MKTTTALGLAAVLALALATGAHAQDKCGATKMKAAGKKAAGRAGCYAKSLARAEPVDPACLAKADAKFTTAYQKADAKGPCLTTNDAPQIEDMIDACTANILSALRQNCGDGALQGTEACDDGNATNGDGCSGVCTVETAFNCTGEPSVCTTTCGDGVHGGPEACDDGNVADGDGCSSTCSIEPGYGCTGQPSVCVPMVCGDAVITGSETCDDGNVADGDGCSSACDVESGFQCAGQPSVCSTVCGDGLVAGSEACDDGNNADGDGCSSTCTVEAGYICTGEPSVCTAF
jgi:cysteine-rich repeat protein